MNSISLASLRGAAAARSSAASANQLRQATTNVVMQTRALSLLKTPRLVQHAQGVVTGTCTPQRRSLLGITDGLVRRLATNNAPANSGASGITRHPSLQRVAREYSSTAGHMKYTRIQTFGLCTTIISNIIIIGGSIKAFLDYDEVFRTFAPGAAIGLVSTQPLEKRSLEEQAELYSSAKKELWIIGGSGDRMFSPTDPDNRSKGDNPVYLEIRRLALEGIRINILVEEMESESDELKKKDALEKRKKFAEWSKNAKSKFGDNVKVNIRLYSKGTMLPFHGDLIDCERAYLVQRDLKDANQRQGSREYKERFIEHYQEGHNKASQRKLKQITNNFEASFEEGLSFKYVPGEVE